MRYSVHQQSISCGKDRWFIVDDETGQIMLISTNRRVCAVVLRKLLKGNNR